jgi:hypothetical protein
MVFTTLLAKNSRHVDMFSGTIPELEIGHCHQRPGTMGSQSKLRRRCLPSKVRQTPSAAVVWKHRFLNRMLLPTPPLPGLTIGSLTV